MYIFLYCLPFKNLIFVEMLTSVFNMGPAIILIVLKMTVCGLFV